MKIINYLIIITIFFLNLYSFAFGDTTKKTVIEKLENAEALCNAWTTGIWSLACSQETFKLCHNLSQVKNMIEKIETNSFNKFPPHNAEQYNLMLNNAAPSLLEAQHAENQNLLAKSLKTILKTVKKCKKEHQKTACDNYVIEYVLNHIEKLQVNS